MEGKEHFEEYGYLRLENIIEPDLINKAWQIMNANANERLYFEDMPFNVGENYVYYDKTGEMNELAETLKNIIGSVIGHKDLFFTYTMGRINTRGQQMRKHTDREPCQLSITMPIAYSDAVWPISVDTSKGKRDISLDVGDILLYKGTTVPHWREKNLYSDYMYQLYFHYVDINTEAGSYIAEYLKDGGNHMDFKGKWESILEKFDLPLRK